MVAKVSSTYAGTPRRARSMPQGLRWMPPAMSRFCRTLSSSKTVAVWKVRPTPARTMRWDFIESRSWLR